MPIYLLFLFLFHFPLSAFTPPQIVSGSGKQPLLSKSELLRKSVQLASGEGVFIEPTRVKMIVRQSRNEVRFFHQNPQHEWKEVLLISQQFSEKESVWKVIPVLKPSGKWEREKEEAAISALVAFTRKNFKKEELEIWVNQEDKGGGWRVGVIPLPMMPDHFTFYSVGKNGSVKPM